MIDYEKVSEALKFFQQHPVPIVEGSVCFTSDGYFIFKNNEWVKHEVKND